MPLAETATGRGDKMKVGCVRNICGHKTGVSVKVVNSQLELVSLNATQHGSGLVKFRLFGSAGRWSPE